MTHLSRPSNDELLAQGYVMRPCKRIRIAADDPPLPVETEVDKQIKEQARNQTATAFTLEQQLSKKRNFHSVANYENSIASQSGSMSLQEYKQRTAKEEEIFELRSCGLTDHEIKIWMEHNEIASEMTPLLDSIKQKIEQKQEELRKQDQFKGLKLVSKQQMELESALSHDNKKQFSKMLFQVEEKMYPLNHPMNNIKQIVADINIKHKTASKREKRKTRKLLEKQIHKAECQDTFDHHNCSECANLQIQGRLFVGPLKKSQYDKYEKCRACRVAVEHNEFDSDIETIPAGVIERYRLSLEDIRRLPRFTNYSPGTPSKVLYLKNLSSKVSLLDLKSLFAQFESLNHHVDYNLLSGKMRGQAFVKFDSIETAQEALNLVNGYDFKGKPIIIEFGKKNS